MNAKISPRAVKLAACPIRGSYPLQMRKALAAAALAAGLILLGLEENGWAANNALDARADAAAKSATSAPAPAPPPVPLGVFIDNNLPQGRFAFAITPIFANYSGILMGTRGVSNELVASTVPFYFDPKQNVRIVPQRVNVAVQAVRLRYGVTNDFEMILDTGWIEKALDTRVFKGTSGTTGLTHNYPRTSSVVDTMLTGVYRVYQDDINRIQLSLGFSFPTGKNTATFNNFTLTNGTRRDIRGFYSMQLGTGTFDALPGAVYAGYWGPWSWGVSYRGRLALDYNPQGYHWGNLHDFNGWTGYTWIPGLTTTFRVNGSTQNPISGFDPRINGPAAPANPLFYGGQRVELFGGGSMSGKLIGVDNATIFAEAGTPVYQNLSGPQIRKNWQAAMRLAFKF